MLVGGALVLLGSYSMVTQKLRTKTSDLFRNDAPVLIRTAYHDHENTIAPPDFEKAAETAVPSVVHIKTVTTFGKMASNKQQDPLEDLPGGGQFFKRFFGDNPPRFSHPDQKASGSGVIVSSDGYIVTNNHVIDGATSITVTLSDHKNYKARVIGSDVNTDLALIKIDAKGLPEMAVGNSDDVHLGEWVLAIGYPLNLDVTVTQGIVSAKSRNIGINQSGTAPVESFIQTDAAVNPGSSGGALINTAGELIGINSAIASPTGAYAGYSYAIPVNLVKKVVNALMRFGNVQRAYLGIEYNDPSRRTDRELKDRNTARDMEGIKVLGVPATGAAAAAGIKEGDIITKINGVATSSVPELMEQISRYKPGDKVSINYMRNNKEYTASAVLKNLDGNTGIVKMSVLDYLGADFNTLRKDAAYDMGIEGGVIVSGISSGLIKKQTSMKPSFVILKAGSVKIRTVEELKSALHGKKAVRLEGFYPTDRYSNIYYYDLDMGSTGSVAF